VNGLVTLTVGAPREATKFYTFAQNSSTISTNGTPVILKSGAANNGYWIQGPTYLNELPGSVSFFAGTMSMTPDSKYLMVSDALSASGQGTVHLYKRATSTEKTLGYENVFVPAGVQLEGSVSTSGAPAYGFYRIGQLIKSKNGAPSQYTLDHYGTSVDSNWWVTVVGAPAEECLYTFGNPVSCKYTFLIIIIFFVSFM